MDATTETGETRTFAPFLAGLQGGMVGVLWMLAWLGVSASWQRRSFWTSENLLASAFYGDAAIRSDFAFSTLSGLALYLLLYSLLGAAFAAAVRERPSQLRTLLLGIAFSLGWYYLSFHWIWRTVSPLVTLLHAERPTVIGHLVYGTFLGRYPRYLARTPQPAPVPETPPETQTSPETPVETNPE
ncbi:MAG TPA: DUF6789 family protein [Candidatus Sulfopaludibacter sp.]|nr:DUF6789 family protein [Candidatus Sulfopaludibacter sp.]